MGIAVATQVRSWTIEEMHRLPEDGNRYELVWGELFVTPPPTDEHETLAARVSAILSPYVEAHHLGHVYRPQAVMRYRGSQVEPDLMVRREHPHRSGNDHDWNTAPVPVLVVEIASPYTRMRDANHKKRLYLDAGVAEYWIVDPEFREVSVIRPTLPNVIAGARLTWLPPGLTEPLTFEVESLFRAPDTQQ